MHYSDAKNPGFPGFFLAAEGLFAILIIRGTCIRKVPASAYGQKLAVDKELCRKCGRCHICPGIEASEDGTPRWNNLCSGCVSRTPACLQMCPFKALSVAGSNTETALETVTLPHAFRATANIDLQPIWDYRDY